ncbi:MAG: ABC transporter ATP-binding protein [Candidatus Altimarinota bacterium]
MNHLPVYRNTDLIKDLVGFTSPYKKMLWWGTILRIISDVAWLYPAIAVGLLIDYLTEHLADFDPRYVVMILGIFLVCSFLHYVGRDIAKYLIYQAGENAALDAAHRTLTHLISLDISWQEKENSGNKMKRISHGQEGIKNLVRVYVDLVIESSINAVFIIIILGTFDRLIAVTMVVYVISYYVLSLLLLRRAKEQSHRVNVQEEHVQGQFFEIINNITTVKWMGLEKPLLMTFQQILKRLMKEIKLRIKYFRIQSGSLGVYNELFRITLLAYIVYGITQGDYGVGLLAIFLSYFTKMQLAADELAVVTSEFIIQKIRISRMMGILQEQPEVELTGSKPFPKKWKKIELKNLNFSYQKQKYLYDVNLTINRGEKIGIIGLSGAGKTTILKLLLKLYKDYEGQILFDDVSLQDIKREDYLKHTAVVLQDTEVFNLSLQDNISLSSTKRSKKDLERSMEIAHINEFLYKLPEGVKTLIGEKGVKLSGGEKQRVGIARAVYKKPQILFLDEATSHLDIDSEEMIQDSLSTFFENITAIVIAHRLSTIKEMDRIIVMKAGRIIEQGSFAYLLKKKGEFHRLWRKQSKKDNIRSS